MLSSLKRAIALAPGWRTPRKLLVIQSDDWFSLRTSSLDALRALKSLGVDCERCHYMMFDHFESGEDLSALFEVLSSVEDSRGRPARITANCLSANPDFARIRASSFSEYYPQSSLDTAAGIPGAEDNIEIWRQGIRAKVCEPQSHGREHLNIGRWIKALRSETDCITKAAFDHGMYGISGHVVPEVRGSFLAAFDTSGVRSTPELDSIVSGALVGFESMFGFPSRSFIAPNYVWSDSIEAALHRNGVEYIQSGRVQWFPSGDGSGRDTRRRFLGHTNSFGQTYIVRNVDFEPSSEPSVDWQDRALSQIKLAFSLRKPAIISTHRVNFMGGLNMANRDRGLRDLNGLLRAIVSHCPGVEFVSTTELGDIIRRDRGA